MAPKKSSKGKVSIPKYRWLMFWLLVLCSVALVCALFGNVDVRTLKDQTSDTTAVTTVSSQVASSTTTDMVEDSFENQVAQSPEHPGEPFDIETGACLFNSAETADPIDTYIDYTEPISTVLLTIPYSFNWGSANCPPITLVSPYPSSENTLLASFEFGPSKVLGGGGAGFARRLASFGIGPVTTADAVDTGIKENESVRNVRQRTISGFTVYDYDLNFEANPHEWIAVGRNYSYHLTSLGGWLTDAEAIKIIQSLRVTK